MTSVRLPNQTYGNILIIDDAVFSAQALTAILTTAGYQVRIAPEAGLAQVRSMAEPVLPDLILLALGTRPLGGYELCRQLKARGALQAVPVILTTRPDEPHDKAQGFQAGAADYLPQPYEAPEVLGRVAAHLALARSQAEIARQAQMETALKESETRLREILENALDAAYRRNLRTNAYDYISPVFARISGYTPAEMATMPLEVVIDRTHPDDRATVAQAVAACLAGQPQQIEYRLRHKDGEYRWLMDQFTTVTDATGQPVSLVGSVSDITARRLAQADLSRTLDRLNLATQAAQLGIWDWDLQTDTLVWDDRMYALYGLKREGFAGAYEAWARGLHPDDRAQAEEAARQALSNEKDYDTEFRARWPDGTVRVLKAYAQVLRDETGQPVRMTGINYDITAQKQAETEIRQLNQDLERRVAARTAELSARTAEVTAANQRLEAEIAVREQAEAKAAASQRLLQDITDSSQSLVYAFDTAGRFLLVSRRLEAVLGVPRETLIGKTREEVMPPEIAAVHRAHDVQVMADRKPITFEEEDQQPDGKHTYLSVKFPLMDLEGEVYGIGGISTDITDRKQTEAALREVSERLEETQQAAGAGTWEWDLSTDQLVWSPQMFALLGLSPLPNPVPIGIWSRVLHPEDQAAADFRIREALQSRRHLVDNFRIIRPDTGQVRWISAIGQGTYDAQGAPVKVRGICLDATAQKEAEEALRRANAYNRGLLEASLDPLVTLSPDGQITDVNQATEIVTGRMREQLIGTDFSGYFTDPNRARASYQQAFREGMVRNYALEIRHVNGRLTPVRYNATVYRDEAGTVLGVFAAARDVTERLQAEAALREVSQRLEATQQAAGAGAWEWDLGTDRVVWSPLMFKLLGLDPQTAVASFDTWRSVVHPEERADAEARIREALETHTRLVNVYRIVRASDGQVRWINAIGEGSYDAQGAPVKMSGICLDVSAQQAVEEEIRRLNASLEARVAARTAELEAANQKLRAGEQRFSSLFYKAPFAAVLVEIDRGVYLDVNEAWIALMGYSRQELLGKTALELDLNPDAALRGRIQADLMERGVVADQEMTARTKSGERRDFFVKFDLIDISGQPCILIMAQDITKRKQQEMQITRLVERFDLATRAARLGVWEADVVGGAQIWDDRMYALYGVSRETFPATYQAWLNCIHPDDRVFSYEASQKALSGEKEYDTEYRVVWPDGTLRWLKAYGQVIRDAEGQPRRMMGINYDITARKQAEEAQQRWAHVFEHAEWGVVIGAANGQTIELLNPAFARMHGYTVDELIGQSVLIPFAPEVRAGVLAHIQQAQELGHHTWEDIHIRKDGSRFPVLIDVTAVRDLNGALAYRAVNVQDITARKRAEAEIRQLNEDLKQHVAELHQANAALTQALQVKNEFLAMMSHELRTPLTAVLGLAETLDMGLYGPLTEKQSRSLQTIQRSGQHLLDLITEVLDFISFDAGRLQLTMGPVMVRELCDLALQSVWADAQRKRLHLTFSPDAAVEVVQGDGRRLKQMLVKFLENAVKFTPEGGALGLEVTGDAARREVSFAVWDTGIGIAPSDQARLFEPFVQIDARLARLYEGTGMGLALAKRLAEIHGGRVAVESEGVPGKGSRFTVSLPWVPLPSVASPTASGLVVAEDRGTDQPDRSPLTHADLAGIPAELLEQMRGCTTSARFDNLLDLIAQAEPYAAETAARLRVLAEEFQYDALLQLFDQG